MPSDSPSLAEPHRPRPILLFAALASMMFMWAFNSIAGKLALRHMGPLDLVSFRFELAGVLMLAIYFTRRQRTPFRARDGWRIAWLALFGVVLNQGGFTVGLDFTTSQHSAVIASTGPIMVLLLAVAVGLERLSPGKALGITISFCGALLLESEYGLPVHSPFLLGDGLTAASTIGLAVYAVVGKQLAKQYDAVTMNTFVVVAAAVLVLPLAVRQGMRLDWRGVGWVGWGGMAYMAIFSSVIAYTLFYWTLRYMEASRVAVVNYFQPVLVILFSIPILGEHPTRHLLGGTVLVLLGVYLAEHVSRMRRGPAAQAGVP